MVAESITYFRHEQPAWADQVDFVINAVVDNGPEVQSFEQLMVHRIDVSTFRICCIPFFLYDVMLGDVVSTRAAGDKSFVLDGVSAPSGRFVFRAWFGESFAPREEIAETLLSSGALLEWASTNLLAIDAADAAAATRIADILQTMSNEGKLIYETGRTA
ncbi:MAG: hypothetical protein JWN70_3308 [Planctomycetaceae bacterium]|nr:hypothetical protein [Planctomycetaceae bacterium]